mmetsp:Transcript_24447/g.75502  ORF Transcript_24447/g.75502 Transcript_24447/m.75502 type:complete len:431 (+) Transcript_24447:168-1460(+)
MLHERRRDDGWTLQCSQGERFCITNEGRTTNCSKERRLGMPGRRGFFVVVVVFEVEVGGSEAVGAGGGGDVVVGGGGRRDVGFGDDDQGRRRASLVFGFFFFVGGLQADGALLLRGAELFGLGGGGAAGVAGRREIREVEDEVADGGAEADGQEDLDVVGHGEEHGQKAEDRLDEVESEQGRRLGSRGGPSFPEETPPQPNEGFDQAADAEGADDAPRKPELGPQRPLGVPEVDAERGVGLERRPEAVHVHHHAFADAEAAVVETRRRVRRVVGAHGPAVREGVARAVRGPVQHLAGREFHALHLVRRALQVFDGHALRPTQDPVLPVLRLAQLARHRAQETPFRRRRRRRRATFFFVVVVNHGGAADVRDDESVVTERFSDQCFAVLAPGQARRLDERVRRGQPHLAVPEAVAMDLDGVRRRSQQQRTS